MIVRSGELLVIQRSQHVPAPGRYCFPGGGIEPGESESQALVREMQEEIRVPVNPVDRLWENATRSGVRLGWWLTELGAEAEPTPNPDEVAKILWLPIRQILRLNGLLETNRQFFSRLAGGTLSPAAVAELARP